VSFSLASVQESLIRQHSSWLRKVRRNRTVISAMTDIDDREGGADWIASTMLLGIDGVRFIKWSHQNVRGHESRSSSVDISWKGLAGGSAAEPRGVREQTSHL